MTCVSRARVSPCYPKTRPPLETAFLAPQGALFSAVRTSVSAVVHLAPSPINRGSLRQSGSLTADHD